MTPQHIAHTLQQDILAGRLPPGTPLSQGDIAARFGVSRIPVRDALARLTAAGVIVSSPNKTATVLRLTGPEVQEAYDLRQLLEVDLLARAVARMTPQHLATIDYALKRSSLEASQSNWAEGDQMFHAALYAAAERPRQAAMADELRRACRVQIAGYGRLTDKTAHWLKDHESIARACHAGEGAAATGLLRHHLQNACAHLLGAMRSAAAPDQKLSTPASVTTMSSG